MQTLVGLHFREREFYVDHTWPDATPPGPSYSSSKEGSGRKVCWGKETIYPILSEVLPQPKKTAAQEVKPRSVLKRRM